MVTRTILAAVIIAQPCLSWAQAELPAKEFREYAGTWVLDESAVKGRIIGLPVARMLTITTTPTALSLTTTPGLSPEVYRFDGTVTDLGDGRLGTFILMSQAVALTTRRARAPHQGRTNIVTDAYRVAGDVLTIERQLSVLRHESGTIATPPNSRESLVYRRR